jgi:hypothetical protein
MTAIEDVWAGRDGLLEELYQTRKSLAFWREKANQLEALNLKLTEGVSPYGEMHL